MPGMKNSNRRWVLAAHPKGLPRETDWRLEEEPVPDPGDGEMLVRSIYLSVDPYMRGRVSDAKNYAAGVRIGEVMHGGGVGEVVCSNLDGFRPGDIVESMRFDWQEFATLGAKGTRKVDPSIAPIHTALSCLGMPGLTAYFAMDSIGKPQAGETVLVSAASGAVGQVVGQIAKLRGCRAVAVAGSPAKLAWCKEIGYDAGIDYKTTDDIGAAIAEACGQGVDIYFDNTGGGIHDAAMDNLALHARIIICGMVSRAAEFDAPDIGERQMRKLLVARARMEGFLVLDHMERTAEALAELAGWYNGGQLKFREDIVEGIENVPMALLRLFSGQNFGKQLIKVGEEVT